MRRLPRVLVTGALLGVAVAAVVASPPAGGAGPAYVASAVSHYPGGVAAKAPAVRVELYRTGFKGAGEPTIGVTKDGVVFSDVMEKVVASRDQGRTWKDVSPGHPVTIDPYLYVDPVTSRVYKSDLLATCQALSWSDDRGATWTTAPAACNQSDHQTIVAGKPRISATVGYPHVLYNCSQTAGYNGFSYASGCAKSLDGGVAWVPTGAMAFENPSPYGVGPGSGDSGIPGTCIGDIGHIWAGDDGTLYVPRGWCGQPWLAWSIDEGLTWRRAQVARNGMNTTLSGGFGLVAPGSGQSDHEAAVVTGPQGHVFFLWVALDRLPYLAVSGDRGRTWSRPMMVGAPGVNEAWGPALSVDAAGRVSVAYMGTTTSPGKPWTGSYGTTTWSGYVARIDAPLAARPLIRSAAVTPPPSPLTTGRCGPDRCNDRILDFIDVASGPDGSSWGAFVDTLSGRELVVARLRR